MARKILTGHKDDRGGDGGKKYGNIRTLVGAYEANPPDAAGCAMFCKTGPGHMPAYCPKFKTGKITEATLHKKKLCTGCLGALAQRPSAHKIAKTKSVSTRPDRPGGKLVKPVARIKA